jgi:hypothetical protein
MPDLNILIPADRRIVAFGANTPPPPGAIAVTSNPPDPAALAEALARIAREAPWVPLAVCTSRAARAGLEVTLSAMSQATGMVPALVVPAAGTHPLIAEILAAVSNRPTPSLPDLAHWVARRLGRPDLLPALHQAICRTRQSPDPAEDRALRRRLAREGLPNPLCLNRIAMLARARRLGRPLAVVAAELGYAPRQMRNWLARLAGCDTERWLELPGWEWVLEEAVRRRDQPVSGRTARPREEGVGSAEVLSIARF